MLASMIAALWALPAVAWAQAAKPVYAHFMAGIVSGYTIDDWKTDMAQAKEIGIDGFALNCAPPRVDSYTPRQIANAYEAATQLGFTVFISFDFAYWSTGDTAEITSTIGTYTNHPAQARYNGGALVSTFLGDSMDWNAVKSGLNGKKITVIPMVQDPNSLSHVTNGIDGAFSWYAWPTSGDNAVIKGPITTYWDNKFLQNLGGKPYMAPVSPWFFTHFNSKNWVFICEEQPTIRWQQMLDMKPALVEIVSWNDFGESHYISDEEPHHGDDGSSQWTAGFPHGAWRKLMKPYIAAYKAGASQPKVDSDQLVYWYRPTPKGTPCSADSVGDARGKELLEDLVFVTTLLTRPAQLLVKSGSRQAVTVNAPSGVATYNFTMGIGAQEFSLSRNGNRVIGGKSQKDVVDFCRTFNYNAYVGSF
ncbi:glycoside hydrolase family 71 protein [Moelleriella libera RCEF 2490]|uniref:glucan endo-1,3-alpha-glucosidase n=1 Tax=Moelleriella libera RCEF 2490 TaxID=1081109 RepID=A0A166UER8_9HYPO|nr:glycoside hydrolase family 71 protein [Moelleriella libera RCEF 2490]